MVNLEELRSKIAAIRSRLSELEVSRADKAQGGPVTLSGWYPNDDGTWTRYVWDSGHLHEVATVRDAAAVAEHRELASHLGELLWAERELQDAQTFHGAYARGARR